MNIIIFIYEYHDVNHENDIHFKSAGTTLVCRPIRFMHWSGHGQTKAYWCMHSNFKFCEMGVVNLFMEQSMPECKKLVLGRGS